MRELYLLSSVMKKLFLSLFLTVCGGFLLSFWTYADVSGFWTKDPIWNQDPDKALNVTWIDDTGNPIRDGMHGMVHNPSTEDPSSIDGVISNVKIDSHSGALDATMNLIQIIINYALWILAFLALVYLIYHGFLMFSAAGDDKKFDKWKSGIKIAAIALIGIGLSWMIVSVILWFISKLTS